MKRLLIATIAMVVVLAGVLWAANFWETKPYTKWKEKESRQLLENSPWCSVFSWGRTGDIGANVGGDSSTVDKPGEFDYERESVTMVRVQLFSARPIRQAYAVLVSKGDPARLEKMKDFATRDFGDEIVVAWTLDSKPKRTEALVDLDRQLHKLNVAELANNTYLATDTGKKVYLKDYIPPTPDGTGAKFVFPRFLPDGQPLLTPAEKSVKFQTKEFKMKDDLVPIDATFKVGKLNHEGQIEY